MFTPLPPVQQSAGAQLAGSLPNPPTQIALLTAWEKVTTRCRPGALNHYVTAVGRTVEDFFARRERGCGMDLRVAVALLPAGQCLVDVELRPGHVSGEAVDELRRRVESLERPPVRGPVAFLLHSLVWGGSDNLADSFRHRGAPACGSPQFRNEYPADFAAAEAAHAAGAHACGSPRPDIWSGLKTALKQKALALYRAFVPPPPPDRERIDAVPPEDRSFERLTRTIQSTPCWAPPYFWRAMLYQQQQQFEAAIADYTAFIDRVPAGHPGRPRAAEGPGRGSAAAYVQRGFCRHASGSRELALADYNEALRRDGRNAAALMHRAMLFAELEALPRAIEDATAAVDIQPEEPDGYLLRGKMRAALGDLDGALADLDRALLLDPHHAESRYYRAIVRRDPRRPGGPTADESRAAIADLSAALLLFPAHALSYAYRAEMHLRLEDLAAAVADATEAIRIDPKCSIAFCLRGHAHVRRGNRRQAIDDCSEAIRLGLDGWLVLLSRADAHFGESQLEDALADCNRALELSPEHAGGLVLRARVQLQMGMLDAALDDVDTAVRLTPGWNVPYGVRGNLRALRGQHDAALEDFTEAIRLEPADAAAHYHRGLAHANRQEFAKAIEDFDAAQRLGFQEPVLYFMRAAARVRLFQPQMARADLDEAIRRDPNCAPAYFSRAHLLASEGQHDAALRDYNEVIRLCPNVPAAYTGRGSLWIQKGEEEKAEQDFREAVQLDPGSAEGYTLQRLLVEAGFHYKREDYLQTIASASEAIDLEPNCTPAYELRAAAHWCMERLVEAVDDYSKVLELDEDSLTALSGRGQVYAEMGEFEQALEDLNRAVELCSQGGPPHVRALTLDGRALANAGLGRNDEADEDFEASIQLCAGNAWVYYYRGLTHHQRGDALAAADCFRRALESSQPALPPRKRERARGYLRRHEENGGGKTAEKPGTATSESPGQ